MHRARLDPCGCGNATHEGAGGYIGVDLCVAVPLACKASLDRREQAGWARVLDAAVPEYILDGTRRT